MRVRVSYSGQARAIAGRASEEMNLSATASLHDLLDEIASHHGDAMATLLDLKQRGTPAVLVFVAEQQVAWHAPPALAEGDEVTLLSPISGG